MERKSISVIYPIVLLLFILFVFLVFFFGENGFLGYSAKVENLYTLNKSNKSVYNKVFTLNEKIMLVSDNNAFYLENEGRNRFLKKSGDIIISLQNRQLIDSLSKKYEEVYGRDFELEAVNEFSNYHNKVLIGLVINIVIAFALAVILPTGAKQ